MQGGRWAASTPAGCSCHLTHAPHFLSHPPAARPQLRGCGSAVRTRLFRDPGQCAEPCGLSPAARSVRAAPAARQGQPAALVQRLAGAARAGELGAALHLPGPLAVLPGGAQCAAPRRPAPRPDGGSAAPAACAGLPAAPPRPTRGGCPAVKPRAARVGHAQPAARPGRASGAAAASAVRARKGSAGRLRRLRARDCADPARAARRRRGQGEPHACAAAQLAAPHRALGDRAAGPRRPDAQRLCHRARAHSHAAAPVPQARGPALRRRPRGPGILVRGFRAGGDAAKHCLASNAKP